MDISDIVKPVFDEKYISNYGNLYWGIIHLEAFKVTIDEIFYSDKINVAKKRDGLINMIEYMITNLMCSCRNHAYQILIKNSHQQYKYIFQYTVDLHNQVNIRLNKPVISYYDALMYFKKYIK